MIVRGPVPALSVRPERSWMARAVSASSNAVEGRAAGERPPFRGMGMQGQQQSKDPSPPTLTPCQPIRTNVPYRRTHPTRVIPSHKPHRGSHSKETEMYGNDQNFSKHGPRPHSQSHPPSPAQLHTARPVSSHGRATGGPIPTAPCGNPIPICPKAGPRSETRQCGVLQI